MKKSEFIEAMKDYAEATHGKVTVEEMQKGGYSYTGLAIKKPNIPAPVVNLDDLYTRYTDKLITLDDCYKRIDEVLKMVPDMPIDITQITDWEKAKSRLFVRVIGKPVSEVSRQVEDLYLVPYIQVSEDGSAITRVTDSIRRVWGKSVEEVFAVAEENQETLRPITITHICDRIGIPRMGLDVYIISTEREINGAGAIFYDGAFEKIREMIGGDFYLLPSSIHEMLAVPNDGEHEVSDLKEMVTMINGNEVSEQDKLTDSIYTYDFEEGTFKKVL